MSISISRMPSLTTRRMCCAVQAKARSRHCSPGAIRDEGYEGFLTLEPHLVLFASLQSLETEDAANIIKKNKAKDGAEGYAMQYHALREILDAI